MIDLRLPFLALLLTLLPGCAPPPAGPLPEGVRWTARGHREVELLPDGSLLPKWLGHDGKIGVCLQAPVALDTSQWRAHIYLDQGTVPRPVFVEPTLRTGSSLCFLTDLPAEVPPVGDVSICGTVEDAFDQRRFRLPCFPGRWLPPPPELGELRRRKNDLFSNLATLPSKELSRRLEALAQDAQSRGLLFFALQIRLVVIDEIRRRGEAGADAEVDRRLAHLPQWLDQPAATTEASFVAYMRAKVSANRRRHRQAWMELDRGQELAQRTGADVGLLIATQQAEILHRLGANVEAASRLRRVLQECARRGCRPAVKSLARDLLAWYLLVDPDAGTKETETAGSFLTAARANGSPDEAANLRINRALWQLRVGGDPSSALAQARKLLTGASRKGRGQTLSVWAKVIEGSWALREGRISEAVRICQEATRPRAASRVSAWAWSCLGQAHRRASQPQRALSAFHQALLHHASASPNSDQDLRVAPGQRTDDYYRTARAAIEHGRPQEAWRILQALDDLAGEVGGGCDEASGKRVDLETRRQNLLDRLAGTEPPLAPRRQEGLDSMRDSLREALEEVHRDLLRVGCPRLRRPTQGAHYRAFALPDEIILLTRQADGNIEARHTAWLRLDLRRRLRRIAQAQREGEMDDETWRALTRPLAQALAPGNGVAVPSVSQYALHGILQAVPFSALPIAEDGVAFWLADLTTVARHPALVAEELTGKGAEKGARQPLQPLFVVDPERTLPSSPAARSSFRALFPAARILFGPEATRSAVVAALPSASFLHIDAHGSFDPAYPTLSGLGLSDGALTIGDFLDTGFPRELINLSGCFTGGARESGDSALEGLAGLLAQRGVGWVVASRSTVADRLLGDFNRRFYRHLAENSDVPAAFGAALSLLRERYPASGWSNLILVGAGHGEGRDKAADTGLSTRRVEN